MSEALSKAITISKKDLVKDFGHHLGSSAILQDRTGGNCSGQVWLDKSVNWIICKDNTGELVLLAIKKGTPTAQALGFSDI